MRNRQRGANLGLLLLASQIFQMGVNNIPPVTLAALGLNVYLFLFPLTPLLQACVSVEACWGGDWRRLLLSPLHHADDWHLYYNMVSLLWKGTRLERRLGGAWFAYILTVFSLLTGVVYLLLQWALSELTHDFSYNMQCAVGFSGVLFGLKVVNNYYYPGGVTNVMGMPVSNKFACWAELILIHVMSPGTSFVGHLAGILVGLLYTHGPLKSVMKICAGFLMGGSNGYTTGQRTYYSSSGFSGYSGTHGNFPYAQNWRSQPDPNLHPYTGGLSEDEQYEAAIRASLRERAHATQARPAYGFNIPPEPGSMEELRQHRLQRFAR
ncbi:hypothetical protein MATL_G00120250 [Megalops atlanticus]|uniref:Peptidase S54 rhomboid domain-containing protein n=1 Tax=Megalops atlanticus TaxID=7932 RepID=A0A9D3TCX4_MEGAT|nr:hypothetical protein MATL_G00120250 [Megalops atlanticus]